MKSIIATILTVLLLTTASAQKCDIAQMGVAIYNGANTDVVAGVATHEQANFRFSLVNAGTSRDCIIPANSVTAILDFPVLPNGSKPYIYDGPATFSSGYFTWTYDPVARHLRGTNATDIPNLKGDLSIAVKVKGQVAGVGQSTLSLTQGNGLPDNPANNISTVQLRVSVGAPLPVRLLKFEGQAEDCDALIKWTTTYESGFKQFELEYSRDAVNFVKIGVIDALGISTGASYHFRHNQLNGNGYYRLKLVDNDGTFEYGTTIKVVTSCSKKEKILVYPNPISYDQKLIIYASGYNGSLKGELFDAKGQKVAMYNLSNTQNEVSVQNLSAGAYMLYVKNEAGGSEAFKIIVTR